MVLCAGLCLLGSTRESACRVRQWCITIATAAAFVEVSTTEQEATLDNSQRATKGRSRGDDDFIFFV